MRDALQALVERHAPMLEAAIAAVNSRANWSPFRDSPSGKFHAPGAAEAGKAAFDDQLSRNRHLLAAAMSPEPSA